MQREDRYLHCESNREGQEQPSSGVRGECCFLSNLHKVKRDVSEISLSQHGCCDDSDQHERRSEHCVEEELCGCINALVVSPSTNEEVHRNKNNLKEDKEQEQVEA